MRTVHVDIPSVAVRVAPGSLPRADRLRRDVALRIERVLEDNRHEFLVSGPEGEQEVDRRALERLVARAVEESVEVVG